LAFGALPGLSAPVSAPAATEGLESAISVGHGWARFVRYQEVGRIQQMTRRVHSRRSRQRCPLDR
jgi:hypothetical protein